jgi:hypothetical protein
MWINRFIFCIWQGHSYIDITSATRPYQYCLRCGNIKEPSAYWRPAPVHVHSSDEKC